MKNDPVFTPFGILSLWNMLTHIIMNSFWVIQQIIAGVAFIFFLLIFICRFTGQSSLCARQPFAETNAKEEWGGRNSTKDRQNVLSRHDAVFQKVLATEEPKRMYM